MSDHAILFGMQEPLRQEALSAHGRDWSRAAELWTAFRYLFPDHPDGHVFSVLSLREKGALAEAEQVFAAAADRLPTVSRLFVEHALINMVKRDWKQSRQDFARLRKRFPLEPEAYLRGSEVAQNLGDKAEALALMSQAVKRFTGTRPIAEHYARLAERLSSPPDAIAGWRACRAISDSEDAAIGEARAVAETGDPIAASALLSAAAAAFPGSTSIAAERARNATRRGAWDEARDRWDNLVAEPSLAAEARSRRREAACFQDAARGRASEPTEAPVPRWIGLDLSVLQAGTWTLRYASGQVLGASIRFGPDGALLNHYGEERSWSLRDGCLCIHDEHGYVMAAFTRLDMAADGLLRLEGRDWIHSATKTFVVLEQRATPIGEILRHFESLGDNCEFGLVQRFHGIEPLGLLRFNWTDLDCLLDGLRTGFAKLAEPGVVQLRRVADGEVVGRVPAYKYDYHTNRYDPDLDLEELAAAEAHRLQYLARRLVEDMEDGTRIYVRKGEPGEGIGRIRELHERIRQIGGGTLLWMTLSDADHPPGLVETVSDGLLRGYIERFAPREAAAHAMFDTWATACRTAYDLVRRSGYTRSAGST